MTKARAILTQMEAAAKESGSERTRSHLALARAAWLIETRKWGEAKAPVMSKGLPKDAAIAELFAIGFAAVRSGNRAGAANAMQQMAALMEETPVNGAPGAIDAVERAGPPGHHAHRAGSRAVPRARHQAPAPAPAPGTPGTSGTSGTCQRGSRRRAAAATRGFRK